MTHFSDKELACRCGCGFLPKPAFRALLEQIRTDYGKPIMVTSGARCPTYNRKIGSTARNSAHCEGIAVDFMRTGELLAFLEQHLDKYNLWMEDPRYSPNWLHVDCRYRPVGRIFKP